MESMNKKGEGSVWAVVLWIFIIGMIGIVVVVQFTNSSLFADVNLPSLVRDYALIFSTVGEYIIKPIYFLVAPSGQDENVQMIAFGIFLLITLIGTKALRPFLKGPFLAFIVSVIIGIIGSRSLTATVLEETALGASPIAAAALLVGFIPVFALTKNIREWELSDFSTITIYVASAVVYFIVFYLAFDALYLGLTYGIAIILLGGFEELGPRFKVWRENRKNKSTGKGMAQMKKNVDEMKAINDARAEEARRADERER
jgi:hypothetical protein